MNLADLSILAQVVGAIAVVASLVFVGIEVHQNTKSNRATTLQMNADYWLSYMTALADPDLSAVYSKGASAREVLTPEEFGRFFLLCRATFMGCENQHYQYRTGLIDRSAHAGYEMTIREQIAAFPGIRAMWSRVRHTYSAEFVAFMDDQIARYPSHGHASVQKGWVDAVAAERRAV